MRSLRNAVKRKTPKERAQPQARQRLGFLEHRKDYVLRARDFQRKKRRLQAMRLRAETRNPDEFYHAMVRTQVRDGKHEARAAQRDDDEPRASADVQKLAETQDLAYLESKRAHEQRVVDRMRAQLHGVGAADGGRPVIGSRGEDDESEDDEDGSDNDNDNDNDEANGAKNKRRRAQRKNKRKRDGPQHTLFLKTRQEAVDFDKAEHFGTVPELADVAHNRVRREDLESGSWRVLGVPATEELQRKALARGVKDRAKMYAELARREERLEKLKQAIAHVQLQRNLHGKGRRKKVKGPEGDAPAVYKWKFERKR